MKTFIDGSELARKKDLAKEFNGVEMTLVDSSIVQSILTQEK